MAEEYHRRTAITRLTVDHDDEPRLRETVDAWRRGCQIAIDRAWNCCRGKSSIQQLAYGEIRNRTSLGSQHAILATRHAADCIVSCISRRQKGKPVSKPEFTSPTVTYDVRTMTLFDDETVSLATTGSRVRCGLVLPGDENGYQRRYLDSDEWDLTESTLHYRDGGWYLHLGFRKLKSAEEETTGNGTVLGVDLGVEQIAVTSTARFFSAAELDHQRREFERIRGELQNCGTRNAHLTIESVSGREAEYVKHALHAVAKGLVEEARRYDCEGIVFEELEGIRERLPEAGWHSRWAFHRLFEYTEYKAELEGIFVEVVDPTDTSKRCAECGFVDGDNRPNRDEFDCQRCGNRNHADYNAAKNVADAYLRRGQQSSRRRGVSRSALKSGVVKPNGDGEFVPYADASEAELTDKSRPIESDAFRLSD